MKFDMHCHTKEGSTDGRVVIEEYIQRLRSMGFGGMMVTDHNSYDGYREWKNSLKGKELGDDGAVTLDVLGHQIVQHLAALTDHLQQAAAGVVVLLVDLQVLGELVDAGGENGDLHLGRTGVGLMDAVGLDNGRLFVLADHGKFHLSEIRCPRGCVTGG